jgi:ketosteroid isomerase-like protein
MHSNLDLVRDIYAAFAAGDVPRFLGHLDAAIVWNEAEGFSYADRNPYVGPEAVIAGVIQRVLADWRGFRVDVGEFAGSGDVVTMFGRYKATHAISGKALDVQVAHTWWFRGGKAVRFQQMLDTAAAARAAS